MFAYNSNCQSTIGMPSFEALYGRKCRSPIYREEVEDIRVLSPDIILETTDKIRIIKKIMKVAQRGQKAYADKRRRPLDFLIGNKVLLKVSPMKGAMCICKKE